MNKLLRGRSNHPSDGHRGTEEEGSNGYVAVVVFPWIKVGLRKKDRMVLKLSGLARD